MAAGATYVSIASQTLSSAAASVTFSSISGAYTDLVLIINGTLSTQDTIGIQFNGDTGNNYSATRLNGDGSTIESGRWSNQPLGYFGNLDTTNSTASLNIMNYSNATTYKTSLMRNSTPAYQVYANVILWRSTAAITSFLLKPISGYNFASGTTLSLYGIAAA